MVKSPEAPRLTFDSVVLFDAPRIFISEPNWHWKVQIPSNYYNLWHVLRGTGWLEVDGRRHELTAGRSFILGPGQRINAMHHRNDPIHNFAAHFRPMRHNRPCLPVADLPQAGVVTRETALFEAMARQAVRLADVGDALGLQESAALVLALTAQVVRDASLPARDPVEQRILPILDRINANPGQRLSIHDMARETGLSKVHFTRRFKRLTGESPNRYLMRRRIERASQLIQQSPFKIEEIAENLGYSDVFFFSRQFKRITGHPPSQLRQGLTASGTGDTRR
jgi:AraC-like DNA-binding protein